MLEKEFTAANGYAYRVQVNEEDAERYGVKPRTKAENKKGPEPADKKADEDTSSPAKRPGAARRRGQ